MTNLIDIKKLIIIAFFLICSFNFIVIEKKGFNSRFKEIKNYFPNYHIDGIYLNSIRKSFANKKSHLIFDLQNLFKGNILNKISI